MKTNHIHCMLTFVAAMMLSLSAATQEPDPVRYEVLLDSKLLAAAKIAGNLPASLDFTSGRLIVFAAADQLYLLGWGGAVPLGKRITPAPASFAFTPDSTLLLVHGNRLAYLDSTGRAADMFTLPADGMGIARGAHAMYLYNRKASAGGAAIYLLVPGGRYTKLLEVPQAITSVQEVGDALLFCTEHAVFQYTPSTKQLKTVAILSDGGAITSVAADPENRRIYFATAGKVYAAEGQTLRLITDRLGGTLFCREGLVIFDADKKLMLRISGLTGEYLAKEPERLPEKQTSTPPLTVGQVTVADRSQATSVQSNVGFLSNQDVISLVRNQLSEDLIIRLIGQVKCRFALTVDDLVSLAENKVPDTVILAMKRAMEGGNSHEQ
jgi:hypothetical protein